MFMSKTAAAIAAGLMIASASPAAFAQGANQGTTLGGSAKDNSASGGSEASGTSKSGGAMMSKKHMSGTKMHKKSSMSSSAGK